MMKTEKMNRGRLVFVGLVLYLLTAAPAGAEGLAFVDAWRQVQDGNDSLAADRANIERTGHLRQAARDLYYPKIEVTGRYTRLDQPVELSASDLLGSMPAGGTVGKLLSGLGQTYGMTPAQLSAGLTSTIADRDLRTSSVTGLWPIYAGGRIDAAQDIAAGQEEEARRQFALGRQRQFELLSQVYFSVVLARDVLTTRAEVRKALTIHRDHAVLLEKEGQIAHVERLQAEASLDKAKVDEKKAGHDLDIAGVALARMLKSQDAIDPGSRLFINRELPPISFFLDKTLACHPGLGIYDAKTRQAEGLVKVEKGKYLPEIALFGSYDLYEDDYLANELTPEWLAGVGISIPLVDRSGRSGNLAAARSRLQQIGSLRAQAAQDLSVLVEKTYRQAEQALDEYNGLGSSLALAEENVRLREKSFDQGLSTSLDVVDSRLFLAGIKTQRSVAAYAYILSLSRLLAMSGTDDNFASYQHDHGIEVK